MALSATTTLQHPVETIAALFADRAFAEHVAGKAGATLESFETTGPVTGPFDAVIERGIPTHKLPEAVRPFVGKHLRVIQRESWSAPEPDGSRTVAIRVEVTGAPVTAKATQRLAARDGATVVELEGSVDSSIPFLGGKIAKAAEPFLGKALNLQAREADAWLKTGR